jgi:rhodanese-related sulfurtransferase
MLTEAAISPAATMEKVLEVYPGAQRSLFRQYHIGGCSQCGFAPTETLAEVCARNGQLDPEAVLGHIRSSHAQDEKIWIGAPDLAAWLKQDPTVRLLDVRSREEYEAVHLPGSLLMSQPVTREIMSEGTNSRPLVILDHQGRQCLDAAAYFLGHGLQHVRCLRGGLDAWSREIDPSLRRYRVD